MESEERGARIKNLRKNIKNENGKPMSQAQLASAIDYFDREGDGGKSKISKYESGGNFTIDTLRNLCIVLDCDADFLLELSDVRRKEVKQIADHIPLSEKAIEYLVWLKNNETNYPDQCRLEIGMLDAIICALYDGVHDPVNKIDWTADELMTALVYADRDADMGSDFIRLNKQMYIRQAFCMALGGVAFDYIADIANNEMDQRRLDLEHILADIKRDEKFLRFIRGRCEALNISHEEYVRKVEERLNIGESISEAIGFVIETDPEVVLNMIEDCKREEAHDEV